MLLLFQHYTLEHRAFKTRFPVNVVTVKTTAEWRSVGATTWCPSPIYGKRSKGQHTTIETVGRSSICACYCTLEYVSITQGNAKSPVTGLPYARSHSRYRYVIINLFQLLQLMHISNAFIMLWRTRFDKGNIVFAQPQSKRNQNDGKVPLLASFER